VISHAQLWFPIDTSFDDLLCKARQAELGLYKYCTDQARDPLHQLSNADWPLQAFKHGCQPLKGTRGQEVILEIRNLVSFLYTVVTCIELMCSLAQTTQNCPKQH